MGRALLQRGELFADVIHELDTAMMGLEQISSHHRPSVRGDAEPYWPSASVGR
jgi:hypothetical protein